MAGAGYKLFNTGDVLTAAQVNTYLQEQTVMVFADASARTTALTSVLAEGMLSYLKDTNKVYVYDGSAWLDVSSEIPSQTGNSGKYLTTDGTTASWATVSSGGMTLIQETTASALSSLSFTSISGTYKQLLLLWSGIYFSGSGTFSLRFNNNSGSDYSEIFIRTTNASVGTITSLSSSLDAGRLFGIDVTSSTLNHTCAGNILIDDYSSTTKHKYFNFSTTYRNNVGGDYRFESGNGFWEETAAITSLDIVATSGTSTFTNSANTSIRLYGVS